jgi:hypothetical protein
MNWYSYCIYLIKEQLNEKTNSYYMYYLLIMCITLFFSWFISTYNGSEMQSSWEWCLQLEDTES